MATIKELPNDKELENAVLGAALLEKDEYGL